MKNILSLLVLVLVSNLVKYQDFKDLTIEDKFLGFTLGSSFEELDTTKFQWIKKAPAKNKNLDYYKLKNENFFFLPNVEDQYLSVLYSDKQLINLSILLEIDETETTFSTLLNFLENKYGKGWKNSKKELKSVRNSIYWKNKKLKLNLIEYDFTKKGNWMVVIQFFDRKAMKRFLGSISDFDETIIL